MNSAFVSGLLTFNKQYKSWHLVYLSGPEYSNYETQRMSEKGQAEFGCRRKPSYFPNLNISHSVWNANLTAPDFIGVKQGDFVSSSIFAGPKNNSRLVQKGNERSLAAITNSNPKSK